MIDSASKRGWTDVRFGDVVEKVSDSGIPTADESETYIGLEHLDQHSFVVSRWGSDVDIKVPKTRVRRGDVLFARRNTHLRRCAVAPFDTYFSPDGYAFRSKSPHLLHGLLLYIVASDDFMDFAIRHSAGTHSKRVKWSDLRNYTFRLPPREEQSRIVQALSAVESAIDKLSMVEAQAERLLRSRLDHTVRSLGGVSRQLADVASIERGKFSHRPRNLPEFYGGDADFVQTGDVAASTGVLGPASQTLSELGKQYSRSFPPGTVLVTIAAVIGATAVATREVWCPDSVVGVVPNQDDADPFFLEYCFRHLRPALEGREATSSTQKNINLATLRPLVVPVPPLSEQRDIVGKLQMIEEAASSSATRKRELRSLQRAIFDMTKVST